MLSDILLAKDGGMMNRLQGKEIFITGASSGIGEKIARKCAEQGANLTLFARRLDKLNDLKDQLENKHVRINVYKLDVGNTEEIKEIFPKALLEAGTIDVLVNNAGFGVFRRADEVLIDEMEQMFKVNVTGLIACTTEVLPTMIEKKRGHIINIASLAGKIATPKSSVYSATKHAVIGYTNSLRMELADKNIFVTAVNPGPIATNFFEVADVEGTYVKNVQRFMLKPDVVAEKVVQMMLTPKRELNLPFWMGSGPILYALFPRLFERVGRKILNKK